MGKSLWYRKPCQTVFRIDCFKVTLWFYVLLYCALLWILLLKCVEKCLLKCLACLGKKRKAILQKPTLRRLEEWGWLFWTWENTDEIHTKLWWFCPAWPGAPYKPPCCVAKLLVFMQTSGQEFMMAKCKRQCFGQCLTLNQGGIPGRAREVRSLRFGLTEEFCLVVLLLCLWPAYLSLPSCVVSGWSLLPKATVRISVMVFLQYFGYGQFYPRAKDSIKCDVFQAAARETKSCLPFKWTVHRKGTHW